MSHLLTSHQPMLITGPPKAACWPLRFLEGTGSDMWDVAVSPDSCV